MRLRDLEALPRPIDPLARFADDTTHTWLVAVSPRAWDLDGRECPSGKTAAFRSYRGTRAMAEAFARSLRTEETRANVSGLWF